MRGDPTVRNVRRIGKLLTGKPSEPHSLDLGGTLFIGLRKVIEKSGLSHELDARHAFSCDNSRACKAISRRHAHRKYSGATSPAVMCQRRPSAMYMILLLLVKLTRHLANEAGCKILVRNSCCTLWNTSRRKSLKQSSSST